MIEAKTYEIVRPWKKVISIQTFSKKEDNLKGILGAVADKNEVQELYDSTDIADCQKYFIKAPTPRPSCKHESIQNFIEEHDFIY
jgi:hypothetical protein